MVRGLVDVGVFALDVEYDRRDSRHLSAMNHGRDGRGLTAARRPDHACVARQHGLVLRVDPRLHVLVADDPADAEIASDPKDLFALLLIQEEHGALRPGPISRRHDTTVPLLTERSEEHKSELQSQLHHEY